MRAMLLKATGSLDVNPVPLELEEINDPAPADDEILIRVAACGVCHTELDEIEGRTPPPKLPVVPGHEVVGGSWRQATRPAGFARGIGSVSAGSIRRMARIRRTSVPHFVRPVATSTAVTRN